MALAHGCPAQSQHMAQHQIGQIAQMVAQCFQRQQILQIHRQQMECLFLLHMAQHIQLPFGIIGTGIQTGSQIMVELLPVRRLVHFTSIQQFVEQCRVQRQVFTCPTAGGYQPGQSLHGLGIFGQKGQVRGTAAYSFQQVH